MIFRNRMHAGRLLAERLAKYGNDPDVLVLALPRGGVVVGYPVADALNAPLDVVIVRKLGVPGYPEYAMGAIASGGIRVISELVIEELGISAEAVEAVVAQEQREVERREALYRGTAPAPPEIRGRTVILVDDGIATGSTMRAAVAAVRQQQPKRLIIAVPVAPPSTCADLAGGADEFLCLEQPEMFFAIGEFYQDFLQVSDEEVRELLQRAAERSGRRKAAVDRSN